MLITSSAIKSTFVSFLLFRDEDLFQLDRYRLLLRFSDPEVSRAILQSSIVTYKITDMKECAEQGA